MPPAGEAIAGELGNPVRDPEIFQCMLGYSPLQNAEPRSRRAAVLVVPAEHDERATPGDSDVVRLHDIAVVPHAQ
jgi:prolyl oligopeptidase PreP (S9A serine peptidase family)